jgi:hypothetical protein
MGNGVMVATRHLARAVSMAFVASAIACSKPVPPTVVYPGLPFNLMPGHAVAVPDALTVIFERVVSDSRCPTDVTCSAAGDAVVHLIVANAATRVERDLHTASAATSQASVGDFTIHLIDLTPYPRSSRVIEPADYTATLQITSP